MPDRRQITLCPTFRHTVGLIGILLAATLAPRAQAQLTKFSKEELIKYTAGNPFDRFPDGRPKVPDALLERLKKLVSEEVNEILPGKGYVNQFEGKWQVLHPGKVLVGRAFTIQYMPSRPDIVASAAAEAKAAGLSGPPRNQTAIDMLQPNDVVVVDLYGSQFAFVGNKLAYYIMKATGTGFVVDGNIYWLERIANFDMQGYFRGTYPRSASSAMVTGINVPVRIGDATVMPGDVVFGDREGVFFIPPQLVQQVVEQAEATQIRDEWSMKMFDTGKYKSGEVYGTPRDPALRQQREQYIKRGLEQKKK